MRDVEKLAAGLRGHLASGPRVTGVDVLSAGHSNETYLVQGVDRILRMPPSSAPLLPCAMGTAKQFDLFAVLRGRDPLLPVPMLDHMCDDPSVLGDVFFLMERVDGVPWSDWAAPDWAEGREEAFLDGISRQATAAIAALNRMGPLDGLGTVLDNRAELGRWRDMVRGIDAPDLERLFERLDASAPPLVAAGACHGDPKYPNMLWQDGKLQAVLDWEMAFNGDPRWDLAYMLVPLAGPGWDPQPGMDLPGLWRRDRVIAEWSAATGRGVDDFAWFEAATLAKVAAILIYGWQLFHGGSSTDARFQDWDQPAAHYVERAVARLDRPAA